MSKNTLRLLACGLIVTAFGAVAAAQQEHYTTEPSLAEQVGIVKAKQDKFNLFLNMNTSLDAAWDSENFNSLYFHAQQLRIEAKGNITPWLSYRWRQRLNRPNNGTGNIDNLPTSIDIAGIGVRPTEKFSMFLGKQCAAYGGIEFDLNPIEIYEYSDMIDNMSNFLTGANFAYDFTPGQQLQFQVLDARNGTYESTYGEMSKKVAETKVPLVYTLNWNGTIVPNYWTTRWSYSYMSQSKEHNMMYVALGNHFDFGPVDGHFDWMYSNEGLNRKGIIEDLENVEYNSFVLKLNYHISDSWNIFGKGMYETASAGGTDKWFDGTKKRTALGYFAGVEYYPMEDGNLHFFLTYVGRNFKDNIADTTASTNKLLCGFIYQLPMF